jgi:hypothetical protein
MRPRAAEAEVATPALYHYHQGEPAARSLLLGDAGVNWRATCVWGARELAGLGSA